jgi:hypothetical protein
VTSTNDVLLLDRIRETTHQKLDKTRYDTTLVRNTTNCYSYAMGSTVSCLNLYRVGAISGRKPLEEPYFSTGEIIKLLYEDFKEIDLTIERSSEEEVISENQYKIALFVKVYADNKIHDFHFTRFEDGRWSEKFRWQLPRDIGTSLKNEYNYWPWRLVGIFKVTR